MNKSIMLNSIVLVSAMMVGTLVQADSYHLRVSDQLIGVGAELGQLGNDTSANIDWLHDDEFDLLRAGLYVDGIAADMAETVYGNVAARIGVKGFFLNADHGDGLGLTIGGDIDVPVAEKFSLYGTVFYGSGKMSFNDIDGYQEWGVGVNARLIKNGLISLGYSSIEIDVGSQHDIEIEKGLMFKIALNF